MFVNERADKCSKSVALCFCNSVNAVISCNVPFNSTCIYIRVSPEDLGPAAAAACSLLLHHWSWPPPPPPLADDAMMKSLMIPLLPFNYCSVNLPFLCNDFDATPPQRRLLFFNFFLKRSNVKAGMGVLNRNPVQICSVRKKCFLLIYNVDTI